MRVTLRNGDATMRIEVPPVVSPGNEQVDICHLLAVLQEHGWTVLPRPESISKSVTKFLYEEIAYADETRGGELNEVIE
jgi:hypothetical protein